MSIDELFCSLARDQGEHASGVVLCSHSTRQLFAADLSPNGIETAPGLRSAAAQR